jgi:hypothetical protein
MPARLTLVEGCARCGREFGCGADASTCWCAAVDLDAAARARLAAAYEGCLCPECLVQPPPEAAGALDVGAQRPHAP